MYILKTSVLIINLVALSTSAQALVSRECEELSSPYLKLFHFVTPPNKGLTSVEVDTFCNSNPHDFNATSVSPSEPETPPECYFSNDAEVVLEIPNSFFNDCKDAEYFDSLLEHYAYKWASINTTALTLLIYNKKHKYLKKSYFEERSEPFKKAAHWKILNEKSKFIRERIMSGEYDPGAFTCVLQSTELDGDSCPDELQVRFPNELPIDSFTLDQ